MSDENRFGHDALTRRIDPSVPDIPSIFFLDASRFWILIARAKGPGPGPGTRARARDPGPGPGTRDQGPGPGPGTRAAGPGRADGRAGGRENIGKIAKSKRRAAKFVAKRGA